MRSRLVTFKMVVKQRLVTIHEFPFVHTTTAGVVEETNFLRAPCQRFYASEKLILVQLLNLFAAAAVVLAAGVAMVALLCVLSSSRMFGILHFVVFGGK